MKDKIFLKYPRGWFRIRRFWSFLNQSSASGKIKILTKSIKKNKRYKQNNYFFQGIVTLNKPLDFETVSRNLESIFKN